MNLKKALIILVVIVVVIVVTIYVMGMFEQTKFVADAATGLGTQATDYVQANIPVVTAYAGTASLAIGGVLAAKKSASDKVAAVTATAMQEKDQITGNLKTAESNLKTAETELGDTKEQLKSATDLKTVAEDKATQLETANKQLTGKLDGMMEMHNNFIAQLTSGAQTVIDQATNQTYKLITLEKPVVK